jgi:hypothetical protein
VRDNEGDDEYNTEQWPPRGRAAVLQEKMVHGPTAPLPLEAGPWWGNPRPPGAGERTSSLGRQPGNLDRGESSVRLRGPKDAQRETEMPRIRPCSASLPLETTFQTRKGTLYASLLPHLSRAGPGGHRGRPRPGPGRTTGLGTRCTKIRLFGRPGTGDY